MTPRARNRAFLARQMLLAREAVAPAQAIGRLVGLQAQVARPPFVGLWTRVTGFRREDLLRALQAREVVRVTAMRATLHLMSADDYVALRGALQPALGHVLLGILGKKTGALDLAAVERLGRTFFARTPGTFDALRRRIAAADAKADARSVAYAVRTHVPLVQACTDDRWGFPANCGFVLADTWLGRKVPAAAQPAHALVRRYLAAFGPATPKDAQTWSSLPQLAPVFEDLRDELVTFRSGRHELFDLPGAPRPPEDTPAPVRYLPDFDNFLLSHDDRSHFVADEHRPKLVTKNLQVKATFLVDGMVAGTWTAARKKQTATLDLAAFGRIPRPVKSALEEEGEALLAFLEPDATAREVRIAR